jgi:hypothetical protein
MPKVGDWNELRRWIYAKDFACKKGDGGAKGRETHLLLNGGRFILPDNMNDEFLRLYAKCLFMGDWLYVVEKKTSPVFYMMAEFDIKLLDREITREEIDAIVRIVQSRVISVVFPPSSSSSVEKEEEEEKRDIRVSVCTAPPKETKLDDGTPAIQSGIHLVWRILVDKDTSWQLRAWMLRTLESELAGKLPIKTSWNDTFDPAIFGANGLRMIGSRKAVKCPVCDGGSSKTTPRLPSGKEEEAEQWGEICGKCQNIGRIDQGRPYELLYVADGAGEVDAAFTESLKQDLIALVRYVSIRAIAREEPWSLSYPTEEIRKLVVGYAKKDKEEKRVSIKSSTKERKEDDAAGGKKGKKKGGLVEVPPSDPAFAAISDFLIGNNNYRGNTEKSGPVPCSIKKSEDGKCYIVTTDSHFCLNKNGFHKHSTVYFVIRPNGCIQKCFSPQEVRYGQDGKTCKEFSSSLKEMSESLKSMIFSAKVLGVEKREKQMHELAEQIFPSYTRLPAAIDDDEEEEEDRKGKGKRPAEEEEEGRKKRPRFCVSGETMEYVSRRKKEYNYAERVARIRPQLSPYAFAEAVKKPDYKIF